VRYYHLQFHKDRNFGLGCIAAVSSTAHPFEKNLNNILPFFKMAHRVKILVE